MGGFVALCVLYVGVESGLGGWEATLLGLAFLVLLARRRPGRAG